MNINKFVQELRQEETKLLEGLVVSPSDTLEKYHQVVGKILGIRIALDTLAQQLSDE